MQKKCAEFETYICLGIMGKHIFLDPLSLFLSGFLTFSLPSVDWPHIASAQPVLLGIYDIYIPQNLQGLKIDATKLYKISYFYLNLIFI